MIAADWNDVAASLFPVYGAEEEIVIDGMEFRCALLRLPLRAVAPDSDVDVEQRWWLVDRYGREYLGPKAPIPLTGAKLKAVIADWWSLRQALEIVHGTP